MKISSIGVSWLRLIAVQTMFFGGLAQAQSTLSLYGTLDMGFAANYSSYGLGGAFQGGSNLGLVSGGQSDNRIGFRGSESLGGGVQVDFVLENAINLGNGTLEQGERLFGRQAWVGLEHKSFGYLRFGRQRSFSDIYLSDLTPFGPGDFSQSTMGVSFGAADVSRLSNMIKVETALMDGLRLGLGYSFSAQIPSVYTKDGRLPVTPGDTENYNYSTNNNLRVMTSGFQYYNGPVYLTGMYDLYYPNAETAQGNYSAASSAVVGAMYDFGQFKISAAYGQTKNGWMSALQVVDGFVQFGSFDNQNGSMVFDTSVSVNSYMLGVTLPTHEASDLFISWQLAKPSAQMQQNSEFAITSQNVFSLGYSYQFTPLTNLYLYAGYATNYSLVDGLTNSTVGVGMRHRF